MTAPLEGVLIVDFSQFLAGPYASLRLLDMGARVVKVENPDGGDLCRRHYLTDTEIDQDSTIFHAINRGKESIALDLKAPGDLAKARLLVSRADVVIQNFRPGVMDRLGLGYDAVKQMKPDIVYGSVSGYGTDGEWSGLPGQDLLAQARSGIMWLSGNADDGPVPLGLPLADISAGTNLAQGILGALFRRANTGKGALVETSLLESLIDLQFEFLTTYCNNGQRPPQRLESGSAHGYLAAPYGVYQTADGYLALAMTPLDVLADALDMPSLLSFAERPGAQFAEKNEIQRSLQERLLTSSAAEWEAKLSADNIWCAKILNWSELLASNAFHKLNIQSAIPTRDDKTLQAFHRPIQIDGLRSKICKAGPRLDEDRAKICTDFNI